MLSICLLLLQNPDDVPRFEEFYNKLVAIEEQEDIWFDRLDRHKENTFEIVCLKNYLKETQNDN